MRTASDSDFSQGEQGIGLAPIIRVAVIRFCNSGLIGACLNVRTCDHSPTEQRMLAASATWSTLPASTVRFTSAS
jgi:hypothetical protein